MTTDRVASGTVAMAIHKFMATDYFTNRWSASTGSDSQKTGRENDGGKKNCK
jgi:hypothetical protein